MGGACFERLREQMVEYDDCVEEVRSSGMVYLKLSCDLIFHLVHTFQLLLYRLQRILIVKLGLQHSQDPPSPPQSTGIGVPPTPHRHDISHRFLFPKIHSTYPPDPSP